MSAAPDPTLVMVRSATLFSLAALPVSIVVAAVWRGWPGALGAAVGGLVVLAFFAFGVLGVHVLVSAVPGLAVVGSLFVYVTQLLILLLVLALGRDVGLLDRPAFAIGAVLGTMVWQVAHTRAFARARTPLYADDAPKEEP